jgi:hypothetical protein
MQLLLVEGLAGVAPLTTLGTDTSDVNVPLVESCLFPKVLVID